MPAYEYEQKALAEHDALVGSVLLISGLTGYLGDTDTQVELSFKAPLRVRVLPMRPEDGILHFVDDWIDPYWDVEILDLKHPELPPEGVRSCWVFGTSYNVKTGDVQASSEIVQVLQTGGA